MDTGMREIAGRSGDINTIVDIGLREMGGELGVVGISRPQRTLSCARWEGSWEQWGYQD
jgi:hypothetical protein